jgi:hypothetical protein
MSDMSSTYEARGNIKRKKTDPVPSPQRQKKLSHYHGVKGSAGGRGISVRICIGITVTANRAGPEFCGGITRRG